MLAIACRTRCTSTTCHEEVANQKQTNTSSVDDMMHVEDFSPAKNSHGAEAVTTGHAHHKNASHTIMVMIDDHDTREEVSLSFCDGSFSCLLPTTMVVAGFVAVNIDTGK